MRVACPACDAAYDIPDHVLASGSRRLRCARCGHEWTPQATAPEATPPATNAFDADRGLMERVQRSEPVPAVPPPPSGTPSIGDALATATPSGLVAAPDLAEPVSEIPLIATPRLIQDRLDDADDRSSTAAAVTAWLASFAVLALLCGAAYVFRDAVQTAWPPSQVLYAALGLA